MDKRLKGIKDHGLDIVKSVTKRVFKGNDSEIERKLAICAKCENRMEDGAFGGHMCGLCFCNLKNLVHSEKGCDLKKWDVQE